MIIGEHSVIRSSGIDDAEAFQRLFDAGEIVSALLDTKHELQQPTVDEIRELLSGKQGDQAKSLNAVEDKEGRVRGFCAIRLNPLEPAFGQLALMFYVQVDYESPIATEAIRHLIDDAFHRRIMHKILAQCMPHERELRALLIAHGFMSDGLQRQVYYGRGKWHDMESLTLMNPQRDLRRVAQTAGVSQAT